MSALRSMGFTDNARNLQALQATNGHVADAVEILCRIGSGPVTASPSLTPSNNSSRPAGRRSPSNSNVNSGSGGGGGDAKENMLRSMGFNDTALIREALRRAGGNTDVAATLLIDEKEKLVKAVHGGSSPSSSSPLPSRLDPPGANKTQSNLLIDVSTPEDNQQQQQQQQLQQMQMQMQMQNAFGNSNQQWPNQNNSDQFGKTTAHFISPFVFFFFFFFNSFIVVVEALAHISLTDKSSFFLWFVLGISRPKPKSASVDLGQERKYTGILWHG